MNFSVEEENLICMYHNADRRRTIGKITAAMPGMDGDMWPLASGVFSFCLFLRILGPSIDGDRIKYSPTSANVREKP